MNTTTDMIRVDVSRDGMVTARGGGHAVALVWLEHRIADDNAMAAVNELCRRFGFDGTWVIYSGAPAVHPNWIAVRVRTTGKLRVLLAAAFQAEHEADCEASAAGLFDAAIPGDA
jgi:hypothetical protein